MKYVRKTSWWLFPFGFGILFTTAFLVLTFVAILRSPPIEVLFILLVGVLFFGLGVIALFNSTKEILISNQGIIFTSVLGQKKMITTIDEVKMGRTPYFLSIAFYNQSKKIGGINQVSEFNNYPNMLRSIEQRFKLKIYQNPITSKIDY